MRYRILGRDYTKGTAYPGQPSYAGGDDSQPMFEGNSNIQQKYPPIWETPFAWEPPDPKLQFIPIVQPSNQGTRQPFNPYNTGIVPFVSNLYNAAREKYKSQPGYMGDPKYTRISPTFSIVEDIGFNPEEYGGYMEDYSFMENMEAGRIFKPVSLDQKILNPAGIGVARTLYDKWYRRSKEIDTQRIASDEHIKDQIKENEIINKPSDNPLDNFKTGASSFWDAATSAFNNPNKTGSDFQMMALVGIGAVLLLVLIVK